MHHGGSRVLVSQHVHFALDSHGQPQELVAKRGGAEEGGALGVWDLVARYGGLGGNLDGVVVELLEGNGVQVVGISGVICSGIKGSRVNMTSLGIELPSFPGPRG